jgi:hypothetical protein
MGNSGRSNGNRSGHGARSARQYTMHGLDPRSQRMLKDAGFTYDARLGAWFNLEAGRVIAFDRVIDRTPEWLAGWLARK